jgi:uncharacterized protein involved in exopolysaccharide biosynthesis
MVSPAQRLKRRVLLVLLLALVTGAGTWLVVQGEDPTYERSISFVILPGADLTNSGVTEALRALDQENAQVAGTIGAYIGSRNFLQQAARAQLGHEVDDKYSVDVAVRPGSDVIEVRLRGPSEANLSLLTKELETSAPAWVDRNYRAYRLSFLETDAPDDAVGPRTFALTVLGFVLGALLGIAAVFFERYLRRTGAGAPPPVHVEAMPANNHPAGATGEEPHQPLYK